MSIESTNVENVITELSSREEAYKTACEKLADAEYAYKTNLAVKFNEAEGTVDNRKNSALIACKEQYKAYLKAEAVKDYTKEMLKDAQQVLSARQSLLSASVRSDNAYANTTGVR